MELRVEEPMDMPSARNVMLPVGIPPLPVNVAVTITADKVMEGFGAEARAVEVVAITTVRVNGADALAVSSTFPV